jgi:hypothetical protein
MTMALRWSESAFSGKIMPRRPRSGEITSARRALTLSGFDQSGFDIALGRPDAAQKRLPLWLIAL